MSSKRNRGHRFNIAGRPWRWVYKSLRRRGLLGLCDYEKTTVTICTSVKGFEHLDTAIHEALHALQGYASEDHVAEVATTLSQILWTLGYRTEADRMED